MNNHPQALSYRALNRAMLARQMLLDVPGAPPRFVPEYDNVLFSYADRARVNPDRNEVPLAPGNGGRRGSVLIDGTFQATWRITVVGDKATLQIKPFARLTNADEDALTGEAARLLAFAADPVSDHDIRLIDPGTGTTPAAL